MTARSMRAVEVSFWTATAAAILAAIFLTWAASLGGCTPIQPQPTTPATCADACAHGAGRDGSGLSCDWAQPSPDGVPCEQICGEAPAALPWALACIVGANSCESAEQCQRR
jgi:hypothetical protein